jgi:cadmium resistance protein CadD (predicted permease)
MGFVSVIIVSLVFALGLRLVLRASNGLVGVLPRWLR